jgi:hypothetical protein
MARRVLHLLRRAESPHPPPTVVRSGDSMMSLDDVAPDRLVREIFDHDLAVVWPERRP